MSVALLATVTVLLTALIAEAQEIPAPDAMTPPRVIRKVEATYTPEAKAAGMEGTVRLRVTVKGGKPVTAQIVIEPRSNCPRGSRSAAYRRVPTAFVAISWRTQRRNRHPINKPTRIASSGEVTVN